jgi:hypothetical protein
MGGAPSRESLPKPPSEFFEPLELPVIPDRYKPISYIKQNTRFIYFYIILLFNILFHIRLFEFPSTLTIKEEDIEILLFETNEFIAKPGDAGIVHLGAVQFVACQFETIKNNSSKTEPILMILLSTVQNQYNSPLWVIRVRDRDSI